MWKNRSFGKNIFWFLDRQSPICFGPSLRHYCREGHYSLLWKQCLQTEKVEGGRVKSIHIPYGRHQDLFSRGYFTLITFSITCHDFTCYSLLSISFSKLEWFERHLNWIWIWIFCFEFEIDNMVSNFIAQYRKRV